MRQSQQLLVVGLVDGQLPKLLSDGGELGVGGLLLGQERGKLGLQGFHRGELADAQTVKGFLGGPMNHNIRLVLGEESPGPARLLIGGVHVAGLGVVDDVGFEDVNLRKPGLRGLGPLGQLLLLFLQLGGAVRKVLVGQTVLVQVELCFRHPLQILHRGPAAVSIALALGELALDVDDALGTGGPHGGAAPGMWFPLPADDGPQLRLGVAVVQSVKPNVPLEIPVTEGQLFAPLDGVPLRLQEGQERVEVTGVLGKSRVNGGTEQLPVGGLGVRAEPLVVAPAATLWIFYDGQLMLRADEVVEPPDCHSGVVEVPELP